MAIIGISGYAGSGKDTVAKVIQYCMSPCSDPNGGRYRTYDQFISMGGGSDLRDFDHHYYTDWEIKKFAGKLKEIASMLTGISVHKFEDQEFKKTTLGPEWAVWKTEDGNPPKQGNAGIAKFMTVRDFMQKLGTDGLRTGLHENVWLNALFADYHCVPADQAPGGWDCDNWIISDCRFPNEAQAIKDRGGIIIRVLRPGNDPANRHDSETALDTYDFDDTIYNDGTIEDLIPKVRKMLEEQSIII